jgi:formate-dependent nitrite reductase membrane component NrfD
MYSLYIIWYIFLAGMGSGAYVVAAVFGFAGRLSARPHIKEYGRLAEYCLIVGPVLVAIAAVFLLFDLGSPEKAYLVLVNFHFSILTIGVWVIILFCALTMALALSRLHPLISLPRTLEAVLQTTAFVLAFGLMSYTGVFLATMPSMPFHNDALLVCLFVLSSLSTGAAAIALFAFVNQHRKAMLYSLHLMPRIDVVLLSLELACLAAYLLAAFLKGADQRYSLELLLFGDLAPLFWVGTVGAGLLVPLGVAGLCRHTLREGTIAINSLLVVTGGFILRYCIIAAGMHLTQLMLLPVSSGG